MGINFGPSLPLGLDQNLAFPKNSYERLYIEKVTQYLNEGPSLYLVIKEGFDYAPIENQDLLCSIGGCSPNSLANNFVRAPYTTGPVYSWLDDYLNFGKTFALLLY